MKSASETGVANLTPAQIARIQKKIDRIKKSIASEKVRFGCYDDSRGLRYEPPFLYMQIMDLTGGLRYYNWFMKNFPDDCGSPIMYISWTALFFFRNELPQARRLFKRAVFSNIYLIPVLLGKTIELYDTGKSLNYDNSEWVKEIDFSDFQFLTAEFCQWLETEYYCDTMQQLIRRYAMISKELDTMPVGDNRSALVTELFKMKSGL
jgi:hypothetical protein